MRSLIRGTMAAARCALRARPGLFFSAILTLVFCWAPMLQAADLQPHISLGWQHPLVPRGDEAATATNVPDPVILLGSSSTVWWNLMGLNNGLATATGFRCGIYVDGQYWSFQDFGPVGAGGSFYVINDGPLPVTGGRHTFEAWYDNLGQIPETDETDNRWAHQWVWTPYELAIGTMINREAPPEKQAGWDAIIDGSPRYYNCVGLSFTSNFYHDYSASWDAVYVYASDEGENYDCRLHPHSTGATDGFAGSLASSTRPTGYLDAVIVNGNTAGTGTRDVGVLNSGGDRSFRAMRVRADVMATTDSFTVALPQYEMMTMHRMNVTVADTGWYTVSVNADPPTQVVVAQWHVPSFATGTISNYDARAVSSNGVARLHRHITEIGSHCLDVYRNPMDGTEACTLTIEVEPSRLDFTPYHLVDGWHSPLVPRPLEDATHELAALPDTLYGNANETYFNYCFLNDSPISWVWDHAITINGNIIIDGSTNLGGGGVTAITPFEVRGFNMWEPRLVPGGRHVAGLSLDLPGYFDEIDETNNFYGEQYCWSPLLLTAATPVTRDAPPDRQGGWDTVQSGEPLYDNCDGLRMPASTQSVWRAAGVMPGAGCDVDLRLFSPLSGTKNGFAEGLGTSAWAVDASDIVLVNGLEAGSNPFDLGALQGSGTADYTAESVQSITRTLSTSGTFGPFQLDGGHILQVHEFRVGPGLWSVQLANVEGTVDWGLSIYAPDSGFKSKSDAMSNGIAYAAVGGAGETLTVDIPALAWYAVAVWKVGSADLPLAGTYQLQVGAGTTPVPGELPLPTVSDIVSVQPNPFNPRTTIRFDLATAGPVLLDVFDLRGQRIRTLVMGDLSAGRHEATWDGRNEHGEGVATGVYLARLEIAGSHCLRKMMLMK